MNPPPATSGVADAMIGNQGPVLVVVSLSDSDNVPYMSCLQTGVNMFRQVEERKRWGGPCRAQYAGRHGYPCFDLDPSRPVPYITDIRSLLRRRRGWSGAQSPMSS
jgi:hypothetical protein